MVRTAELFDNPFWNFSLQFYDQKGISEILLRFQDECQVDINLMLYCCWAGLSNTPRLTAADLTSLRQIVDRWQSEIVQPLRFMRETLKTDTRGAQVEWVAGFRANLQQVELAAERLQQDLLYTNAPREIHRSLEESEGRQNVISNLELYLTQVKGEVNPVSMEQITELVDALFNPRNKYKK